MGGMLVPHTLQCPYCGEQFDTTLDLSGGEQQYVEDCQICCRPIVLRVQLHPDGELRAVETSREND
jgi:hypothetical protein